MDHVKWNRYEWAGITGISEASWCKTKRRSPCPRLSWQLEHVHIKQTKCPLPFCSEPRFCPGLYGALLAMLKILVSWQQTPGGCSEQQHTCFSRFCVSKGGLFACACLNRLLAPLLAGFCAPGATRSPTEVLFSCRFEEPCLLRTNLRFEQHHLHIWLQRCLKLSLAFRLWRVPMVQRCRLSGRN